MENKKPLIIVPPMSEPMAKLKEVLEGIANEENIEIFTVNDAKEFGQLVGSGGQALIILSNAKICATLLQENKSVLAKNHSKVILLTPKEIPQKTLAKFTKIGLTESILENTAPKTLLYKVKLQLKSIKTQVKEDVAQQVVKSMLDTSSKIKGDEELASSEQNLNEKTIELDSTDTKSKKKFSQDESENLDYLAGLRGKKNQAEEVIETHWKSKREKKNEDDSLDEGSLKTKSLEDETEIDNYYRGKLGKQLTDLEIIADDIYKKPKIAKEEAGEDLYKRKELAADIELDLEKDKKKQYIEDEEINDYLQKRVQREIEEAEQERKKTAQDAEELDFDDIRQKLLDELEIEKAEQDSVEKIEDLGGHYKGKVNNTTIDLEEPETTQEAKIEEIDLTNDKEKEKYIEEEDSLLEHDSIKQIDEAEEADSHEGKVDFIDNYMRGEIETTEEIKTHMESDFTKKEDFMPEEEADEGNKEEHLNQEEAYSDDIQEQELKLEEENLKSKNRKETNLTLLEEENDNDLSRDENNNSGLLNQKKLDLQEEDDLSRDTEKFNAAEEDDEFGKRETNTNNQIEKEGREFDKADRLPETEKTRNIHEGQTEKISTYYKTNESKDKDQDWNLKNSKKDTQLEITKEKQADEFLKIQKKQMAGETTIDYRKLKQEFDQIARGEFSNENGENGQYSINGSKDFNSEDQFKVIELGPTPFDFTIEILNLIYERDTKPIEIVKAIAEKLIKDESGYLVTHFYNSNEKKYTEHYNSYLEKGFYVENEIKDKGFSIKSSEQNEILFHSFSMPTWICRQIPDAENEFWRDFELPSWANQELKDKEVEFIYPFFDGVDRVGYSHLFFPKGIDPAHEKKIVILNEMLNTVFLENSQKKLQAKKNEPEVTSDVEETTEDNKEKSKVLDIFSGLFGKKKAG